MPQFLRILLGCYLFCAVTGFVSACSPPPIASFGTMPETRGPGGGSVQGGYGFYYLERHLGAVHSAFGLTDAVDLNAGAWVMEDIYMGNGGAHFQVLRNPTFPISISGGLGLGAFNGSLAYGAYAGFTLGWRPARLFGFYQGNRYQIALGEETETTHYGHHVLGVQIDWTQIFFTNIESGYYYYATADEGIVEHGPSIVFASFGVRWGPPPDSAD